MLEQLADRCDPIRLLASARQHRGEGPPEIVDVADEEIVLVAVMHVERRAADAGTIENILHRDGVECLLQHQLDQSVAEAIASADGPSIEFSGHQALPCPISGGSKPRSACTF